MLGVSMNQQEVFLMLDGTLNPVKYMEMGFIIVDNPMPKTFKMKPYMSKCCGGGLKMKGGTPDFIGEKKASTYCFVCAICKKPCDIEPFNAKRSLEKLKKMPKNNDNLKEEFEDLKIEIFPDKEGGKWGNYENNLVWTDGHTIAEMEAHIFPSLFWENDAGQHRDRLWVKVDKKIINQILSRQQKQSIEDTKGLVLKKNKDCRKYLEKQKADFKRVVEEMSVDKNFSEHWKIGYFKCQADILKAIEDL